MVESEDVDVENSESINDDDDDEDDDEAPDERGPRIPSAVHQRTRARHALLPEMPEIPEMPEMPELLLALVMGMPRHTCSITFRCRATSISRRRARRCAPAADARRPACWCQQHTTGQAFKRR